MRDNQRDANRIYANYWLETPADPLTAAEVIAGEQSSGTFLKLANETAQLKAQSGARVERLQVLDRANHAAIPGLYGSATRFTRAELELSWPLENLGPSLPNLLATIAGNLFELRQVSGLRLTALQLPAAFGKKYPGPGFGIEGTRRLSGVSRGPLIGTIIKPSVGLSPEQTALEVRKLVDGGIDFIKDDELQADGPHCPFEQRVRLVMHEVNAGAHKYGRKAMVAFNITGDLDEMRARHDLVESLGGTCVMASMHSLGLVGMIELRKHARLPIHAHRNGWGYLNRSPALGFDYAPWQQMWRLAGADHLHVNGLANKFSESNDSVIAAARAVLAPATASHACVAMPVFSSGQTGLQARPTYDALGGADLIHAAGGGIFGHPDGVKAGVSALREAWQAAMLGENIHAYAETRPALKAALRFW